MIKLTEILNPENKNEYYVHLSCLNKNKEQPLDIFLQNEKEYQKWQEWKGNEKEGKIVKEKFPKRDYIMTFAQIYNESNDLHLFTGIYQITKRLVDKYEVEKTNIFENFIGKLKIKHKRKGQASAFLLENIENDIFVHEILPEKVECKIFESLNKINLKFSELEIIIKKNIRDWKLKLDNLQGIYLLIDDSNNQMYVGSACGNLGIWQRWSDYVYNYTGKNKGLDELHKKVGENHFRKHFRFVLLEYFTDKIDKDYVLAREIFWKNALNTRVFGHNRN